MPNRAPRPKHPPLAGSETVDRKVALSAETIGKLITAAPRYTSYPTADRFRSDFSSLDLLQAVFRATYRASEKPLSVYIHIPFCRHACFYCACNRISTQESGQARSYLDRLLLDIDRQAALFRHSHRVESVHFGGGTPTFLDDDQLFEIVGRLTAGFSMTDPKKQRWSIEIDPRTVDAARLGALAEMGFDRASFGVQDTDEAVQKAIGRRQPNRLIAETIASARDAGFYEIGLDMLYGLPRQNLESYKTTLEHLLGWQPDTVSFFNYAHLPSRFSAQRRIVEAELPSPAMRASIMQTIVEAMTSAGYRHIGLDHFAKPETALAKAQADGSLHRNFQGYSVGRGVDLIGIGVSAISQIDDCYAQNWSELDRYLAAIDASRSATYRGIRLSRDDRIRQTVIDRIMCRHELDYGVIETLFAIDFRDYFAESIDRLASLERLGLLVQSERGFSMTDTGRLFLRHAAMAFDGYLDSSPTEARYSPTL